MTCYNKINGGVKFFDENFALFKEGGDATATSNNDAIRSILDVSRYTQWESIGSNDLTTETIVVSLPFAKEIDSLFLVDMNFKEFTVKYNSGGMFVDFANVYGINDESKGTINETDFSRDTAFYQFDAVTTDQIEIKVTKTQVANEQKYLGQFIMSEEIGTFEGFPRVQPESNRNETKARSLSRRIVAQKTYETNKIKINFKSHPFENDIAIINELFDREDPFLIYPCGGRAGTQYFKMEQKNWRLRDIYNVQILGRLKNEWEKGVYLLGAKKSVTFEEHI